MSVRSSAMLALVFRPKQMNRTSHELVVCTALEASIEIISDLEGKLPDVRRCCSAVNYEDSIIHLKV